MKIPHRALLPLAVTLIAVAGLTACGSDDDGSAPASSTTTAPAAGAVIGTTANADLGTILVDGAGRTVYTLTDNGEAVDCTGTCLAVWPPVLLPDGTESATAGPGVTGLGAVTMPAGRQVTSNGLPLYTFAGDDTAGAVNGNEVEGFGGIWRAVIVPAAAATSPETSTTTAGVFNDGY
jgi:predicted lipoprotein with Yx(FWY)xxD motif